MSKGISEENSRVSTASDAAVVQSGGLISMTVCGVTISRFVIIGGFLLLWEIASGRWIEPFLISSPSRILSSLVTGFISGDLIQHTWVTFQEIAIGFPVGAISGIALGYGFGRSRLLAEIFEPIIIALNGIPRTALAPLFIVRSEFPVCAISGIALGYGFGRSRLLAEIFEPIIIALNGIPRTALAPLFIV